MRSIPSRGIRSTLVCSFAAVLFVACSSSSGNGSGDAGLPEAGDSGSAEEGPSPSRDTGAEGADSGPPTGFTRRPYLFQGDQARLGASIAAGDPEAIGSISNNAGQPLAFVSICKAALANRASYSDMPTWHLAFAGWISGDANLLALAHSETMAIVTSQPNGVTGTGSEFQHSESAMLDVAGVADLAYSTFSPAELAQVAAWVNGTLANWNTQNASYWPLDQPLNNYWQNGILAVTVAGIATEGFNSQASAWRAQVQTMAGKWTGASTPAAWNGPVQSEGHYYATYVRNAVWAMVLYDRVMGTTFLSSSGFSPSATLDMLMYETRPHLAQFFEVGSEPASSFAPFHATSLEYWHLLINLGSLSDQAHHAKSLVEFAAADPGNFWSRASKGFANFYWNLRPVTAAPLATKTDRMLALGTPGAGLVGIRSNAGFDVNGRAAILFANQFNVSPPYSHGNPDAPGFQWGDGSDWLVTDPEYFSNSGILAEGGSGVYSDVSNIVTLAGQQQNTNGSFPVVRFAEDNRTKSVPHVYALIDAQPYWTAASVYRRDYVWLDDLRVVAIFDHVVSPAAKTWRLHVAAPPSVAGTTVTFTVGAKAVAVRDLFSTGAGALTASNLNGSLTQRDCYRIAQVDSSADYRSLKVLDVGGRVSAASSALGTGSLTASLTVGGTAVSVTFYDDGTHALVQ